MNRIVECVPNFSEGRRPEVIDAIVQAITFKRRRLPSGPGNGCRSQSRRDHDRSVS
jgi:glutamate formiminotransferase